MKKGLSNILFVILLTCHQLSWADCAPSDPPECRDAPGAHRETSDEEVERRLIELAFLGAAVLCGLGIHYISKSTGEPERYNNFTAHNIENRKFNINFYSGSKDRVRSFGINLEYRF